MFERDSTKWRLVSLTTAIIVLAASSFGSRCEAQSYQEAPMLRELVERGKLPPVEQRLPEQPAIVQPYEKTGVYGGQLRTVTGSTDNLDELQYFVFEPLMRFTSDGVTIVPNVVSRWELSEDAKSITLHLRKGMRWSDGVPVTVDDVLFAWYDVILNTDITLPSRIPSAFKVGGEPMELERIDNLMFRLEFSEPYGAIPYFLTRTIMSDSLILPKHYLKDYHPKYTPEEEILAKAKQAGFASWFEFFRSVNYPSRSTGSLSPNTPADYPTLGAWQVAQVPATGHVILKRNPYYWKIDPQGNQLPYIDRIQSTYIGNPEARNLEFVSGKVDFASLHARLENSPLFLSNRQKGGYNVYFWQENQGSRVSYYFNQTHLDPALRKIFQDRRFRVAMSLAINRREINDIVYFGKCTPRQDTVNRICSFFEPQFETNYARYDPQEANRILDEMGLKRRGTMGWRYMPDGKQLVITLDVHSAEPYLKTAKLVKEYWQDAGILLNWRVVQSGLLFLRMAGNLLDVLGNPNDVATDIMVLREPLCGIFRWAPLWYRWFVTEGRQGEEPPERIKAQYRVWEELRRTADPQERIRLGKELIRSKSENLWGIGTVGNTLAPVIVSKRLHNVPQYMKDENGNLLEGKPALCGWPWLATFLHHPEQFYIRAGLLQK